MGVSHDCTVGYPLILKGNMLDVSYCKFSWPNQCIALLRTVYATELERILKHQSALKCLSGRAFASMLYKLVIQNQLICSFRHRVLMLCSVLPLCMIWDTSSTISPWVAEFATWYGIEQTIKCQKVRSSLFFQGHDTEWRRQVWNKSIDAMWMYEKLTKSNLS